MLNEKYTMNINLSAVYDKDEANVDIHITDSDGIDVRSVVHTDDPDEDILLLACEDISENIHAVLEEKDEEPAVQDLLDEIQSLKIDNQVLEMRLKEMDKAYLKEKAKTVTPQKQPAPRHQDNKKDDVNVDELRKYVNSMLKCWMR